MTDPWDSGSDNLRSRLRASSGGARRGERIRTGSAVFNGRELRMMIGIGLVLGIAMFQGARSGFSLSAFASDPAPETNSVAPAADPYAEARLSRAILDGQSGTSDGTETATYLGGTLVRPGGYRLTMTGALQVRGALVRLADVDLPRLRGACPYESQLGGRALRRLGALLSAGPFELSEGGGRDTDSEGRQLRIATRGGRSIGAMLVDDGLAHEATGGSPPPWCASGVGTV